MCYKDGIMAIAARIARCPLLAFWNARFLVFLGALGAWSILHAQPGALDLGFNPGAGVDQSIYSIAVQSDGKILIGGDFSTFSGTARTNVARLDIGGGLDTNFVSSSAFATNSPSVNAVVLQEDRKVLLGGSFANAVGTNLMRLSTNGAVDLSFAASTDSAVNSLVVQTNGSVVIGGFFTNVNGMPRTGIARLNTNAVLDAGFNPTFTGGFSAVYALAAQSDGKIIVGGSFTNVNGTPTTNLARLNVDGSLDPNFKLASIGAESGTPILYALSVDGQGRVLAGGDFSSFNGAARSNFVRLNSDGALDTNFNAAAGSDSAVYTIAVQNDGKALLGGLFTLLNGTNRNYIGRLNNDGSLDTTFDSGSGANYVIYSVALQADGKVLIGGSFTEFNGTSRRGIARLQNPPRLVNPLFSNNVFNVSILTLQGKSYILQFNDLLTDNGWTGD